MPASPNTCTRQDGRRRSGGVCFAALTVESVLVPEGLCPVSEGPDSRESALHQSQPRSRPRCLVVSGCGYNLSSEICTSLHPLSHFSITSPCPTPCPFHPHLRHITDWRLPMRKISNQWGSYHPFIHACILPLIHVHASLSTPPSLITRFSDQLFLRLVSTFFDPSHPDLPCLPS